MADNLTLIKKEYEELKGQYVLSHDKAFRLVGIVDDEEDYYYCLYNGREFELHSCVGRITPLKGWIREEDYNEMIRIAKLNHFDQPEIWGNKTPEEIKEFNHRHKAELLEEMGPKDVFIFGPCFDLN